MMIIQKMTAPSDSVDYGALFDLNVNLKITSFLTIAYKISAQYFIMPKRNWLAYCPHNAEQNLTDYSKFNNCRFRIDSFSSF